LIRINKYLSLCGVTSRRGAEALISQKRVIVNDKAVEKLGTIIDEENDVVKVDGTIVSPASEKLCIILYKPKKVMTTLHDPFRRKTVANFIKNVPERVYPIGRLDFDTEGIILLTNDGDLAYRLAHPKFQVEKIYEAKVTGKFTDEDCRRIKNGIKLEDGAIGKGTVRILRHMGQNSLIRLTLTEGRKREVKQLCKNVGHPVKELKRVEFAGLTYRGLQPGNWRHLSPLEWQQLNLLVGL
jgi:23S rRNA pseudouridine2605 synthase